MGVRMAAGRHLCLCELAMHYNSLCVECRRRIGAASEMEA